MTEPIYRIDREKWESRDRFDHEALDEMLNDGVLVPMERGLYVTGDFDSVSDMFAAAQDPNRHVTFQWIGDNDDE